MRGDDNQQEGMFSYVSPEKRVPADHPLRPIRKRVDEILKEMSPQFAKVYSDLGRPSIAPERLLRSLLSQIFYSVRSERMLIEQLQYNLLFRWFVGMEMDEAVWNHAVYSKNRERLLNEEVAETFFQRVLDRARPFAVGKWRGLRLGRKASPALSDIYDLSAVPVPTSSPEAIFSNLRIRSECFLMSSLVRRKRYALPLLSYSMTSIPAVSSCWSISGDDCR
jgi:transposase